MQISSLIGRKIDQTQGFLEDGRRVPLSIISVAGNVVTQIKTQDREGYNAIQLGFGSTKATTKPILGHIKKAGLEKTPRFFREIRVHDPSQVSAGKTISVEEVFEAGDVIDVEGKSKGKGFAGVVKRHGFAGGPRTHGQSDRVTIKKLEILGIEEDKIYVKGLIPGVRGGIVMITKVGKNKKFVPLYSKKEAEDEGGKPVLEAQAEEAQVASSNTEEISSKEGKDSDAEK